MEALPVRPGRVGIGAEVVVERDVLLEDHDDVADRRPRAEAEFEKASVTEAVLAPPTRERG